MIGGRKEEKKEGRKGLKKGRRKLASCLVGRESNGHNEKQVNSTSGSSEGTISVPFLRYMDSDQSLEQI